MVTKGIITSIDFNGNTCQVRIPFFETVGNDPIISTAVVSNTPGSYNGYKVDDVVLVAFEDGKMETPVVIGKLYLGAEKEKADPRGSLNTESLVAAKTAAVPADTKLTTNTDKNLPNTMNPYANLSSIANNLNKLNTDVNYLDVFTNNQFKSVITDVNKQGEQLRSEIKQTAENIEAKVDKEHDGTTTGLGWNLTDTKWTIDATNTAWPTNKLTLFEVDKDGQVIINGNVRIGGYPQSRTRFYKKLAADAKSPAAPDPDTATEKLPDEGWHETYEWENNYHIWETIQTIAYDTNDKGELQLKITYSTPVDITGAAGEQGISIKSQIIYYAMVDSDITHVEKPDYTPEGSSNKDNHVYGNSRGGNIIDLTTTSPVKGYGWSATPHEYIDGWNYYTSVLTIYSDDDQTALPAINHRNFADPVKAQELNGVYELAQGKSKNYYSETDPAGTRGNDAYGLTMRKGYCWFDTGYTQISTPEAKSGYLGKWLRIQDANGDYVVKSGENPVRLIKWKDGITDQRYNMIKVDPGNIDTLISNKTIVVGMTEAFETGNLKQWDGTDWVDISGELVTNKLTANYIDALDITAKKITVLDQDDNTKTLFEADGINGNGKVSIANFTVKNDKLYSGEHDEIGSTKAGIYLGSEGLSIGSSFKITTGNTSSAPTVAIAGYTKSVEKKYCIVGFAVVTATTDKPTWWDNWNDTNWSDTPPDRRDGSYIWEWTKTTSTTDVNTADTTKETKVCITGAKGDPGKDGTNPYVGTNGNWWIGEKDTGIKAEGTDGHTPVITIGENGNWYIDGEDTGVLAKGTPGEQGAQGIGISECKTYYSLSNTTSADGPETGDSNIVDTPAVNKWSESPQAFDKNTHQGYEYWTVERRVYTNGTVVWGTPVKASMLSIDFINSLGITAKKITVLQDNSKESNDSNPILFQADGTSNNSGVKIGGFTVDSNRLYAGNPGTSNSIELASSHKLIAYKSNNQGIALSYAVSKITVNKDITNLTVYIRSYAETYYDYIMISNPNVPSYPTTYLSNYVKAYTMGNQNSSSALASYKKVEYYGLKQNDCIYVVYKKDGNTDSGTGTGYLLIPETTDISIEAVDDTYYFVRDTSLDTKEPGASLKVGSNFSVDSAGAIKSTSGTIGGFTIDSNRLYAGNPGADNGIELASIGTNKASIKVGSNFSVNSTGAIKSTSGTIGKLAIDENGLSYGDRFKIDPTVDNWGSAAKQKATVVAGSTLVQKTLILPGQSKDYYDQWSYYWPAFDQDGFKVLYTANWTDNSNETYKLGEYNLWDLAGIPIVSSYNHTMTLKESLACFGEDRTKIYGWGAPIIYTAYHITVGQDWFEVDLNYPTTNNIRKILTVVCTPYVQPTIKTINNKVENTAQVPNQSVNLFVSYDNYSNGKFWIRSNTKEVTVSILAIGVAAITKVRQ